MDSALALPQLRLTAGDVYATLYALFLVTVLTATVLAARGTDLSLVSVPALAVYAAGTVVVTVRLRAVSR